MGRFFRFTVNTDDMRADLCALEHGKEWGDWLRGFLLGTSGVEIPESKKDSATGRGHAFGLKVLADAKSRASSKRYRCKENDPYLDPRWQRLRLQVMERDGFACVRCSRDNVTLHVHHLRYVPGGTVWDSPVEDLVTLCDECHDKAPEHKRTEGQDAA